MVKHFTLTLTTGTQRLSAVFGDFNASGAQGSEVCWSVLSLQADAANTGPVYLGGYGTVLSSSAWGIFLPIPASSVPAAPVIITEPGAIRLDEWTVIATAGEKLHITVKD